MNRIVGFFVAAFLLVISPSAFADAFIVRVDTGSLLGPQTFGFALTDGNTASNTVTLTNFIVSGGSVTPGTEDCTLAGTFSGLGCSGNMTSGVTLQDLDVVAFFTQQFVVGSQLSFVLTTTNNFSSGFPDQLSMFLCNGTMSVCYSDEPITSANLLLDLTGAAIKVSDFQLYGAAADGVSAPVVTALPEPTSLLLLGTGLAGAWARRRKK